MKIITTPKNHIRFIAEIAEPGDFDSKTFHKIEVELKVLDQDDWDDRLKANTGNKALIQETLMDAVVEDENDKILPFNAEVKQALLKATWLVAGLMQYQVGIQSGQSTGDIKKRLLGN